MKVRVGAVFIPVIDLEESINWYLNVLELKLIDNWGAGASFSFNQGESLLALIKVEKVSPLKFAVNETQSNVYFHFETDDLAQLKRNFESKGIRITSLMDHGLMNELFIIDPSGNEITFFCEKSESPFYKHATGKTSW
ncbi:MAG: VOC family protein [Candidatus Cohnella colombiensis]|uniref:VOC family protein n=1 Tax=Candidatus Cohnella colombiensis TaxID=3121368 RepID=A0AA95F383_9BACL|nr:MAG: VOC family protein [Cohnella sp.]